jgi:hypothetical protein
MVQRTPSCWDKQLSRMVDGISWSHIQQRNGEALPGWPPRRDGYRCPDTHRFGSASGVRPRRKFSGRYPAGRLDEIRIWKVTRSGSEIATYRNKRLAGSETGLKGYWRLDEGIGQTVYDATELRHHAQLGSSSISRCLGSCLDAECGATELRKRSPHARPRLRYRSGRSACPPELTRGIEPLTC